ncbi:MAG: preprotein translocase subunit SecE [Candidatus Aureabacteria bacterium]|nr:preprotein translocase subunit SecE [Candidatus Auribacterota bacterium]
MFEKVKTFLVEVGIEMNKVSWPIKRGTNISPSERYRELSDSTIMVIASSIALAAYIGVMDIILSSLMGLLIG